MKKAENNNIKERSNTEKDLEVLVFREEDMKYRERLRNKLKNQVFFG